MKHINIGKAFLIVIAVLSVSMQLTPTRTKSTAHFRMQYEKGIPEDEIRYLGAQLDSTYMHFSKLFNISISRTIDIYIYKTIGKYRLESQSTLFDDGYYRAGRLYLMAPANDEGRETVSNAISRIVVRAILEYIPSCPEWLKVGYSFMAGRDLERFGPPVRVNVAQFSDLGEDYNRSVSKRDLKELYAKIAETQQFIISRYGENTVVQMLGKFKTEDSLSEIFEAAFNEKMDIIEDAWVKYLEAAEQRR